MKKKFILDSGEALVLVPLEARCQPRIACGLGFGGGGSKVVSRNMHRIANDEVCGGGGRSYTQHRPYIR